MALGETLCCRAGKLEHTTIYKGVLHSAAEASDKRPVVLTTIASGYEPLTDIVNTNLFPVADDMVRRGMLLLVSTAGLLAQIRLYTEARETGRISQELASLKGTNSCVGA